MKSMIAVLIDEELSSNQYLTETSAEFIQRICSHLLVELEIAKAYSMPQFASDIVEEIEQEVIEVFRMKTYGHYNLQAFRQSLLKRN